MESAQDGSMPKYALQLLAYLLNNDLDRARLLWRRVPEAEKERNVELRHLWAVAGLMLAAHRRDAFAKLAQHKWSNILTPCVEWLVDSFRERNATLLLNAYSNVSITVAAGTLGLEPEAAVAFLVVRGWTQDGALLVAPPVAAVDAATKAAIAKSQDIGAEEVARLAEQVLFVEQ